MCDFDASGACAMDGAGLVICNPHAQPCPAKAAFGYVDNSTGALQPYLDLVHAYGWANYMFQTNQGDSYPAHQFLFGATSAPSAEDDHNGIFIAEDYASGASNRTGAGCTAEATTRVPLINSKGVEFTQIYPCFEHRTVGDLLGWKTSTASGIWTAPNSINHICVPLGQQCTGKEWTSHLEFAHSAILSDISTNCRLRGVSWVIPDEFDSDHSGDVKSTGGPSWVASIVNAVGTSTCKDGTTPYWDDTAIIVTWDDWGDWYDHEPPFIEAYPQGGYQMGFRVPLIVVSAYTPAGFINNSREDFGSIARFVERNFGIMEGALTFADKRAFISDFTKFFSLGEKPRKFKPIKAPLSAQHFIDTPPSGEPPDDD